VKNKKGQSLVELIFSIAIIVLVLTGITMLMTSVLGARTKNENRRKATELGDLIVEDLVNEKKNDPSNFWLLNNQSGITNPSFPGYSYSINFNNITSDVNYPNCGVGATNCADVNIDINWSGNNQEDIKLNRFFYKQ
jgi:type II secretory pathway pseudopilin PulG